MIIKHQGRQIFRTTTFSLLLTLSCVCPGLHAAGPAHPVKISQAQIAGSIFEDYAPVVATHDGNTTHDKVTPRFT